MNTEEAKLILGSIHSAADPESTAEVGQALVLLGGNSELKRWFEAERAFDEVIAGKLAKVEAPADLKATIFDLLDAQAKKPSAGKLSWWRPQFLAAAAAVVLVPVFALQLLTGRASAKSFDAFRSDMVDVAKSTTRSDFKLDLVESDLKKIFAFLNSKNAICPDDLPECVACADSVGCKIVAWGEESVTLICLKNESDLVVHCFIIPRREFDTLPNESRIRETLRVDDLETSGWSDQANVYLLVGSGPNVKVKAPKAPKAP